ncbi:MAG: SGNH/GDSL hydrolase family protein, partial [Thermodesulfobacteriota bacterium]
PSSCGRIADNGASRQVGARKVDQVKKPAFWLILILLVYAFTEIGSYTALILLRAVRGIEYIPISAASISPRHKDILENLLAGKTTYVGFSSTLGWTIKPNGFAPRYRANSAGIRANREFALHPPRSTLRVAAFGDSFTHADDVETKDTWQEVLMRTHERVEVLNFGVGGYGLDQAFLRYRQDGVRFNPDIVLIGFMSENIYRTVSVYRPFYAPVTNLPLAKPWFTIQNDALVLMDNPTPTLSHYRELLTHPESVLPRLGAHDHFFHTWYKQGTMDFLPSLRLFKIARYRILAPRSGIEKSGVYATDSHAFKITAAVFELFFESARRNGSLPIALIFPSDRDIARFRAKGTKRYAPLLDHLQAKGLPYIDLLDGFETQGNRVPVDALAPDHYSPLGNQLVR